MAKKTVDIETKRVTLSREYPFGDTQKAKVRGVEKNVTVLTITETTGVDDEAMLKIKNPSVYDEIATSCGLTKSEAITLASTDARIISEAMQSFLYDSEEIELLD